jgi:hypothetical protein
MCDVQRAPLYSLLHQGWASGQHKAQYDESGASAFKEQFYGLGPLVGGCVWDEQFHTSAV